MKKLHMNSLNLLPPQKVLTQKRNKHIDKKAHIIHLKIQVVILTHPIVWVHPLKQDPNTIDKYKKNKYSS